MQRQGPSLSLFLLVKGERYKIMRMTRREAEDRIARSPYRRIIKSSVHNIPERLADYDDSFFVVWNNMSGKYEVHSRDNGDGSTYCMTIPYKELDARTLELVKKCDTKHRSVATMADEIDKSNKDLEDQAKRDHKNLVEDIGLEYRKEFQKAAFELGL